MNEYIINTNLDVLYLPSIVESFGETKMARKAEARIGSVESSLITDFRTKTNEKCCTLLRYDKGSIIDLTHDVKYEFNQFTSNPMRSVVCPLISHESPVLLGKSIDFDLLKGVYDQVGALNFSNFLKINKIKSYIIEIPEYPSGYSVDSDPFEFLLIQNGLERIDKTPIDADSFNTMSNEECWNRYINDKRVKIYEYDPLHR